MGLNEKLAQKVESMLTAKADWMMIKEIHERIRPEIDRMYLAGFLDCLVDLERLEFKQAGSAKLYRVSKASPSTR